jgi:hypothetical protein
LQLQVQSKRRRCHAFDGGIFRVGFLDQVNTR